MPLPKFYIPDTLITFLYLCVYLIKELEHSLYCIDLFCINIYRFTQRGRREVEHNTGAFIDE